MGIGGRIPPLLGRGCPVGRKKEGCMSGSSQFLLYTAPAGAVKVEVFFREEPVWLTQKALAELFGVKRPACGPVVNWPGSTPASAFSRAVV